MYSGELTKKNEENKSERNLEKCPPKANLDVAIEVLQECQDYLKHGGSLSCEAEALFIALGIEELLPKD